METNKPIETIEFGEKSTKPNSNNDQEEIDLFVNSASSTNLHEVNPQRTRISISSPSPDMVQFNNTDSNGSTTNSIQIWFNEYSVILSHICVIIYVLIVVYLCLFSGDFGFFTWHPMLLSIGWAFLLSEAVLSMSKLNIFTSKLLRPIRIKIHWMLHSIAIFLISIGFTIVYLNKNHLHKEHFTTWHGTFGLISILVVLPTILLGIYTNFSKFPLNSVRKLSPTTKKLLHSIFAVLTIISGGVVLILGLYTKWFERRAGFLTFICAFTAISIGLFGVLCGPIQNLWKLIKFKY